MNEAQDIKKMRVTLYEDVWAAPMTAVAVKYGLSDTGVRKRCKSYNIPIPPFGYWAKVKAGKPVAERPPLPPYDEIILSFESQLGDKDEPTLSPKNKTGSLELLDLEELSIDQLENMHGLDLLDPDSIETFNNWCNSLVVPGRVNDYDDLISKHKLEIEYREVRDKEYPFRNDHIDIWKPLEKVKKRDNEAVLPIEVSNSQLSRAYRIVDTLLKAFKKLKASFSIDRSDRDNITITLLRTMVSFNIYECKTKRRYLADSLAIQNFRPLYEEVFDGRLQIVWQIRKEGYYYGSNKEPAVCLSYIDSSDNLLENQISTIIIEVYKQCCNNKILNMIDQRKMKLQFEQEANNLLAKEQAEIKRKNEVERQARKNALIKGIVEDAKKWFEHEKLSKYADELEIHKATCSNEETIQLLQGYIQLVRENADKYNPLSHILHEMKVIESQENN